MVDYGEQRAFQIVTLILSGEPDSKPLLSPRIAEVIRKEITSGIRDGMAHERAACAIIAADFGSPTIADNIRARSRESSV